MTITLWATFIILLLIDLLLAALRVSMLNTRMPLLITLRDRSPQAVERTIALLGKPRFRISMGLIVVIIHYLLLGVVIWLFLHYRSQTPPFALSLVLLALAGLVLLMIEYALEGLVLLLEFRELGV